MAKPVICDRCREVVPEEEIIPKSKTIPWLNGERIGIKVQFVKGSMSGATDAEVCRKCGVELIIKTGEHIREHLEKAEKEGKVFSL